MYVVVTILLVGLASVPLLIMYGVMWDTQVKYGTPFELRQRQFCICMMKN